MKVFTDKNARYREASDDAPLTPVAKRRRTYVRTFPMRYPTASSMKYTTAIGGRVLRSHKTYDSRHAPTRLSRQESAISRTVKNNVHHTHVKTADRPQHETATKLLPPQSTTYGYDETIAAANGLRQVSEADAALNRTCSTSNDVIPMSLIKPVHPFKHRSSSLSELQAAHALEELRNAGHGHPSCQSTMAVGASLNHRQPPSTQSVHKELVVNPLALNPPAHDPTARGPTVDYRAIHAELAHFYKTHPLDYKLVVPTFYRPAHSRPNVQYANSNTMPPPPLFPHQQSSIPTAATLAMQIEHHMNSLDTLLRQVVVTVRN